MPPGPSPEEVIRRIGRRIAELRRQQGLTQQNLAKSLRVTIPWVSRVERAGENLTIYSIVRIARVLGVDPREVWEPPKSLPKIQRGRPKKTPK